MKHGKFIMVALSLSCHDARRYKCSHHPLNVWISNLKRTGPKKSQRSFYGDPYLNLVM